MEICYQNLFAYVKIMSLLPGTKIWTIVNLILKSIARSEPSFLQSVLGLEQWISSHN